MAIGEVVSKWRGKDDEGVRVEGDAEGGASGLLDRGAVGQEQHGVGRGG